MDKKMGDKKMGGWVIFLSFIFLSPAPAHRSGGLAACPFSHTLVQTKETKAAHHEDLFLLRA